MIEFQKSLNQAYIKYSKTPFLITENQRYLYVDLKIIIKRYSEFFINMGFKKGDKIAVLTHNTEQSIFSIFALFNIGVIVVQISYRFPNDLVLKCMQNTGCSTLLIHKDYINNISNSNILNKDISLIELKDFAKRESLKNTIKTKENNWFFENKFNKDDFFSVIFTSGSSSSPKAVVHTWSNHYYSAIGSNKNIKYKKNDVWLLALPIYHVGGLSILFRAILNQGSVYLPTEQKKLEDKLVFYEKMFDEKIISLIYLLFQLN